jgi:hypothetical protein
VSTCLSLSTVLPATSPHAKYNSLHLALPFLSLVVRRSNVQDDSQRLSQAADHSPPLPRAAAAAAATPSVLSVENNQLASSQTIPADQNAPPVSTSKSSSNFPIAATIVLAILGGVVVIVAVVQLFRWRSRVRSRKTIPPPMTPRSVSKDASMSMLLGADHPSTYSFRRGSSHYWDDARRTSRSGSVYGGDEFAPGSGSSPTGSSPSDLEPPPSVLARTRDHSTLSTDFLRQSGSRNSVFMASTPGSRASVVGGSRRSMYATSVYGSPSLGPGEFSPPRPHRFSGPPHSPHARVEIVPPYVSHFLIYPFFRGNFPHIGGETADFR